MNEKVKSIAAVILASGMSTRMGEPKQLLSLEGVPLLEFVIQQLLPHPFSRIITILGHESERIMERIVIKDSRFNWQVNPHFHEGQSSTLKYATSQASDLDGIMVFLGDQPLIQSETIELVLAEALRRIRSTERSIVVQPSFLGETGHPVFFSCDLFPFFEELRGDEGGKRVIRKAVCHHILPVEDPGILFDVDTREDYQTLLEKMGKSLTSKSPVNNDRSG